MMLRCLFGGCWLIVLVIGCVLCFGLMVLFGRGYDSVAYVVAVTVDGLFVFIIGSIESMKRAVTGVVIFVGLVLVICVVMGFVLLGGHGIWYSEVCVFVGGSAIVVESALVSVIGFMVSV